MKITVVSSRSFWIVFSPVDLNFGSSRWGCYWQWLVSTLAALSIALSALPVFTRCVLLCLLVTYLLLSPDARTPAVSRMRWHLREGGMKVMQEGEWLDVNRISNLLVTRWVIFIRLHIEQRYLPVSLTVWRDAASEDGFRRLSIAARIGRPPQLRKEASDTDQNR